MLTCKLLRSQFAQTSPLLAARCFTTTASRGADFTHAVIGAGAVGLAIARKLAEREGTSTVLIERNTAVGMETSSRNSEVIHAGLYYGVDSLKTKLCVQGREMMYALCEKYNIPAKNTGKWIVAQTDQQWEEIVKVHKHSKIINVPTNFVSLEEAHKLEPFVRAKTGILASPTSGIVDSHSYMQFLLGAFTDAGGDLALNSSVTNAFALPSSGAPGSSGYAITTVDCTTSEEMTIQTEILINSAGLSACDISNMILPESRHVTQYFAKGNYFSYSGSKPSTSRLIYPAPEPGHAGLGTHLTLDIAGRIKFGPDVEWVDSPNNLAVNGGRLHEAILEIKKYMPDIDESKLNADYAGIRPKLGRGGMFASDKGGSKNGQLKGDSSGKGGGIGGDGGGFIDFVIRKEEGFEGFVNLLGIESPGLTSSLAIGEMVDRLIYK